MLISGGGTGGHIYPALAIANAWMEKHPGSEILFVGAEGKMEMQKVPEAGYTIKGLPVAGLQRSLTMANLSFPFKLWKSLKMAATIVNEFKPQVVVGVGGYASGPGGVAAWLKRLPLFIHEQNAVAGSTNRLLAKLARKVLVAFPAAFAGHAKQQLVGNPVRAELINIAAAHDYSGSLKVLVVGGSLGAQALNDKLPAIFAKASDAGVLEVRHQTGKAMQLQTEQQYQQLGNANLTAQASAFIDDMAQAYAWADVVICRAGASTVSELACAGVAAVFVPLPSAIDDHQSANARWLTEQGAALLLAQHELTEQRLLPLLQQWLHSKAPLQQMAVKARACALDHATAQVVALCQQVVGQQVAGQNL